MKKLAVEMLKKLLNDHSSYFAGSGAEDTLAGVRERNASAQRVAYVQSDPRRANIEETMIEFMKNRGNKMKIHSSYPHKSAKSLNIDLLRGEYIFLRFFSS